MDPHHFLAKARDAAARRHRRPFDPDRDRLASRDPLPDIRRHEQSWRERSAQGNALAADAMRRGLRYEQVAPHLALFAKAMERAKAHYVRAARAWASGASDHIPAPVADTEPALDLAGALWKELGN